MWDDRTPKEAVKRVWQRFADLIYSVDEYAGQVTVSVKGEGILKILGFLRDDPDLGFDYLQDICGVDLGEQTPARFAVVYQLYSFKNNAHLRLKAFLEGELEIDSAVSLWPAAGWAEREVYDMYGIRFRGHPDLKRILLPEWFKAHPLRKDYPLQGEGERDVLPG